jgi:outer membrane protein TolC
MKSLYKSFLLVGGWLLSLQLNAQSQPAPQSQSFTLDQCIEYAIAHNPNLNSTNLGVKAAEKKVGETLASGLPQVTATADLGNNIVIPSSFLPASFFPPGSVPAGQDYVAVKFGTQYVGRASLNVDQMIFNGSYFVGLKASRTYTELSRKDVISSKTDLVATLKKAYYSVLVSRERLSLVEKNYQRLDSLLNQTRAMFNNGFAEKIDVSRVLVQYNNIITTRNTNQTGLEVSMNLLKWQMGLPMDTKIELTDNLESIHLQVLDDDFKKNFNYINRIEYAKLEVNRELVKLDIKNTNAGYLPRLDFYGNYGASYGTSAFSSFVAFGANWRDFAVYGIRANLPIFDGLRKSNQLQQKKIQLQQLDNSKEFTRNQIDMEQQQTTLTFNNNLQTLKSQKENMQLAEEVYNV